MSRNILFAFLVILLVAFAIALFFQMYSTDIGNINTNSANIDSNTDMNNINDKPATPTADIFPEPNQPPFYYATVGNDWVKINDNWDFRFAEVTHDSRCPVIVVCEVNGKAAVKVQFRQPNVDYTKAYYETLEVFGINRYNNELKEGFFLPVKVDRKDANGKQIGFTITLADLDPHPQQDFIEDPSKEHYTGLFKIEALK